MWRRLYDSTLRAAGHRHAVWYLSALSFAESSFFPIPPDVMLAPMAMARREAAWRLAAITTVTSVLGGLLGYFIGAYTLSLATSWLQAAGHWHAYLEVQTWFTEWGFLAVLLAGFSPIPYKVFTIAAGAGMMPIAPFIVASAIGRGGRFFLVAGLVRWLGPVFERRLLHYIDWIGWILVALIVAAVAVYRF